MCRTTHTIVVTLLHVVVAYTRLRNEVTSNDSLEQVGRLKQLDRCMYLALCSGSEVGRRTMTATVEGIVGAAHLAGGMDAAKTVVEGLGVFDVVERRKASL